MEKTARGNHEDMLLDEFLVSPDLSSFLNRLSELAALDLSVHGEVACSVTLGRRGRRATLGSSDPIAEAMDEIQYASGEGPCHESVATGRTIYVPDLRSSTRYPRYRDATSGSPLRSVFSTPIPLPADTDADAALNSYSTEVDGFSDELRAQAENLAALASRALQLAVRLARETDRSTDLAAALESRTTISLAAGVIMAQSNCSAEEAMRLLKKASMNRNVKLRDVAAALLSRYGETDTSAFFG